MKTNALKWRCFCANPKCSFPKVGDSTLIRFVVLIYMHPDKREGTEICHWHTSQFVVFKNFQAKKNDKHQQGPWIRRKPTIAPNKQKSHDQRNKQTNKQTNKNKVKNRKTTRQNNKTCQPSQISPTSFPESKHFASKFWNSSIFETPTKRHQPSGVMKTPRKSANGDGLGDPRTTPLPRLLGFGRFPVGLISRGCFWSGYGVR